jgi:hypothetical protein
MAIAAGQQGAPGQGHVEVEDLAVVAGDDHADDVAVEGAALLAGVRAA